MLLSPHTHIYTGAAKGARGSHVARDVLTPASAERRGARHGSGERTESPRKTFLALRAYQYAFAYAMRPWHVHDCASAYWRPPLCPPRTAHKLLRYAKSDCVSSRVRLPCCISDGFTSLPGGHCPIVPYDLEIGSSNATISTHTHLYRCGEGC